MRKLKKVLSVVMVFVLITAFLLQMTVLAEETTEAQTVQKERTAGIQAGSEEEADDQASDQKDSSEMNAQDKNEEAGETAPEETKEPEKAEVPGTIDSPEETEVSDEAGEENSEGTKEPGETEALEAEEGETEISEAEDPEETEISEEIEEEISEETEISEEETETSDTWEESEEEGEQTGNADSAEDVGETETEANPETEAETTKEGTESGLAVIEGVVLLEGYSEEELKDLSLSVVLNNLKDSAGNSLKIPSDASTVWILIKDENKTPVFNKKYDINSEETLDFSSFVSRPGCVLELTVGNGEKKDPGNIQYVLEIKVGDMLELGETDDAMSSSLLPLEEVNAYLYVNPYEEETIKATSIKWILENLQDYKGDKIDVPQDTSVVWYRFKVEEIEGKEYQDVVEDDYTAASLEDVIDLTPFALYYRTLELIVGSGKQLDDGNVRYLVNVRAEKLRNIDVSCQAYVQKADGTREELKLAETYETASEAEIENNSVKVMRFVNLNHSEGDTYYIGVTPKVGNSEKPYWEAAIYNHDGLMSLLSGDLNAPAITDQILGQDLSGADTGYKKEFGAYQNDYFGLVYRNPDTGKVYETKLFGVEVLGESCSISPRLYKVEENGDRTSVSNSDESSNDDSMVLEQVKNRGVIEIDYSLERYCLASVPYNFSFHIESEGGETDYSTVEKAVVGLYDSQEEAEGQKDIKDLLISYGESDVSGYQADYSRANGGQDFTLFFKNGITDCLKTKAKKEKKTMTIEFTDREYRYESGHAPRGYGRWGFSFEGHEFWATGTLTAAKKACRAEIKRLAPKEYTNLVIVNILP